MENYYCVSPIIVIAFELQQRDTFLICIYLLLIMFFFLSCYRLVKSPSFHTATQTQPLRMIQSNIAAQLNQTFGFITVTKFFTVYLESKTVCDRTNISYLVSLKTRTCKMPGGKKTTKKVTKKVTLPCHGFGLMNKIYAWCPKPLWLSLFIWLIWLKYEEFPQNISQKENLYSSDLKSCWLWKLN